MWPDNLFKIINGDLVSVEPVGDGYLILFTLKPRALIFGFDVDLPGVLAQTLHCFPTMSVYHPFPLVI